MNPIFHTIAQGNLFLAETPGAESGIGYYMFVYSALVMATIIVFGFIARQGLDKNRIFRSAPAKFAEQGILFANNMAEAMMGKRGKKYGPFLFALWSFIFVGNLYGLFLSQTPTADWSFNVGMAIISVFYVQWEGMKENGPLGHVLHFSGPKMTGFLILISGMLLIVEIVSECFKLLSLSIRLYANIHGGHQLRSGLDSIPGLLMHNPAHMNVMQYILSELPIGGLVLPLEVLAAVIQAFVWVILTCTYISLVTTHEEEHAPHATGHGDSAAMAS